MDLLALLLVAGSLGLNNFAASIAIGLSEIDRLARVRVAVAFGLFEAGMPVAGLLIGREVSHSLGSAAHIVGGLLLIAVGAQVTVAAARSGDEAPPGIAGAPMARMLLLAAALSIDNLVVGFALGAYRVPVAVGVAVIAVVSVALSLAGLEVGARLGSRVGHRSGLIGNRPDRRRRRDRHQAALTTTVTCLVARGPRGLRAAGACAARARPDRACPARPGRAW